MSSPIPNGLQKDLRKLAEEMRRAGWRFERRRRHVWAYAPDGVTTLSLPGTPSDFRSLRNAEAAFKRWTRGSAHAASPRSSV
jgi:hypothetical protein